eukprot:4127064-Pyramimonas_sp.AAC.1
MQKIEGRGRRDHISVGVAIGLGHQFQIGQAPTAKSSRGSGPQHADGVPEERAPDSGILERVRPPPATRADPSAHLGDAVARLSRSATQEGPAEPPEEALT